MTESLKPSPYDQENKGLAQPGNFDPASGDRTSLDPEPSKLRVLDLFCCQGGASEGYRLAGFDVVGVDIDPQPRYPFPFLQMDVMGLDQRFLRSFDVIHASPPCQAFSQAQRLRGNDHPDLIGPVRDMLLAAGVPYIIENVPGAPLRNPLTLCGGMFPGLYVYRHRMFETSFRAWAPHHPPHDAVQVKMGRPVRQGEFIQPVGNFSNVEYARKAMGAPWMSRDGLREAIPPAYTEWLGRQLRDHIASQRAAA